MDAPRRVLVVSAYIGGGHDATGRALQERVGQLWPGSTVRWSTALPLGAGLAATVALCLILAGAVLLLARRAPHVAAIAVPAAAVGQRAG